MTFRRRGEAGRPDPCRRKICDAPNEISGAVHGTPGQILRPSQDVLPDVGLLLAARLDAGLGQLDVPALDGVVRLARRPVSIDLNRLQLAAALGLRPVFARAFVSEDPISQ